MANRNEKMDELLEEGYCLKELVLWSFCFYSMADDLPVKHPEQFYCNGCGLCRFPIQVA